MTTRTRTTPVTQRPRNLPLAVSFMLKERGWTTKILAEKTGMSESYLTHIKNSTRRWNEDSLSRIAHAFDISPAQLLTYDKNVRYTPAMSQQDGSEQHARPIPVVFDLKSIPATEETLQPSLLLQIQNDPSLFTYVLPETTTVFAQGTCCVISQTQIPKAGDMVAAIYKTVEGEYTGIFKIAFAESFIILEPLTAGAKPVALVRGKDEFIVIGRVVGSYQVL